MREDELTLGDAMRYFNDPEWNLNNELLDDFRTLLRVHREYINNLSHKEYQEFKRRRAERCLRTPKQLREVG